MKREAKTESTISRRSFLETAATLAAGVAGAGIVGWPFGARAATDPIWRAIPDQTWAVGVPVHLDLADYATSQLDADLLFTINQALPPGMTLEGSVIRGTPSATMAPSGYVATAEDNVIFDDVAPLEPTGLVVE